MNAIRFMNFRRNSQLTYNKNISSCLNKNMPVVSEDEYARRRKPVRYPYCVVWTPIPLLSWFLPFIGHTGITTSEGKIRDFAGSYYVSEDEMAFGNPTKIWKLDLDKVKGGTRGWDHAVTESSLEYGGRIHNLFCDNCHSHVAKALNIMEYNGQNSWNMCKVAWCLFLHGKYINLMAWIKSNLPFLIILSTIIIFSVVSTAI